jgi:hypothetical protein
MLPHTHDALFFSIELFVHSLVCSCRGMPLLTTHFVLLAFDQFDDFWQQAHFDARAALKMYVGR